MFSTLLRLFFTNAGNRFLQTRLIESNVKQDVSSSFVGRPLLRQLMLAVARCLHPSYSIWQCVIWLFSVNFIDTILAFDIRPVFVQGRHLQLALVSRRSRFRAGTRYFRRGIDGDGHVANFNETEQLLFVEAPSATAPHTGDEFASKLSFVQIRGSVPLYWAEINNLRYKPDLQVMDLPDTVSIFIISVSSKCLTNARRMS